MSELYNQTPWVKLDVVRRNRLFRLYLDRCRLKGFSYRPTEPTWDVVSPTYFLVPSVHLVLVSVRESHVTRPFRRTSFSVGGLSPCNPNPSKVSLLSSLLVSGLQLSRSGTGNGIDRETSPPSRGSRIVSMDEGTAEKTFLQRTGPN